VTGGDIRSHKDAAASRSTDNRFRDKRLRKETPVAARNNQHDKPPPHSSDGFISDSVYYFRWLPTRQEARKCSKSMSVGYNM